VSYLVAFQVTLYGKAKSNSPLKLDQTITMPGVHRHMGHIFVDVTGNGFIALYGQMSADNFAPMVKIASETDSQPSLWVPQFDRMYISVVRAGSRDAEIPVYEP
jgi:hypothetical protein